MYRQSNLIQFQHLIEEFCAALQIPDTEDVLHRGLLNIGDTAVRLEYVEAAGQCRLLVDLGWPPAGDESLLHRQMLSCNFQNATEWLPTFGVNPASGRMTIAFHTPLQEIAGGSALVDLLRRQVEVAHRWRDELANTRYPDPAAGSVFGIHA